MSFVSRQLVRLLQNRPHAIGAEVGVFKGNTSAALLGALPGLRKLICVDPWVELPEFKKHSPNKAGRVYNANWAHVRARFVEQVMDVYGERALPLQMLSITAADLLPNNELNFLFLDGNHGLKYVREDIRAWWPKVKMGGLVTGDDYVNKPTYGVIQAVQELFNGAQKHIGRVWYVPKTKEAI